MAVVNPNDSIEDQLKAVYTAKSRKEKIASGKMPKMLMPGYDVGSFRDDEIARERQNRLGQAKMDSTLLAAKAGTKAVKLGEEKHNSTDRRYVISETGVILRDVPSGIEIRTLRSGTPVSFTGERRYLNGRYWDEVEQSGNIGWIATDFLGNYHPTTVLMRNAGVHFTPSQRVDAFIRNYEGFSLTSYDAVPGTGDWTIGWGHKLHNYSGQRNNPNITWTLEQAEQAFIDDMQLQAYTSFIPFLIENNITLTQQQFDAMLSWTFNFGEFIWDEREVGREGEAMRNFLLAGDFSEQVTRAAFARYMGGNAEEGHILRRLDEIDMFLFGYYERR